MAWERELIELLPFQSRLPGRPDESWSSDGLR
jgi:hypothetical protein